MAVNSVTVIGNLGATPEVRTLPSSQSVANLSLATTERFTDRNGGPQPGHFIDVDRFVDAFDFGRAERLQREISLNQIARLFADCDRSGRRQRLHPRREIGGVSNRGVLNVSATSRNRTRHSPAGAGRRRTQAVGRQNTRHQSAFQPVNETIDFLSNGFSILLRH